MLAPCHRAHTVHGNIRNQRNGVLIILQGDIHPLLVDFHIIGNDLDNIVLDMLHDLRGHIRPVMDQDKFQPFMRLLGGAFGLSAEELQKIKHTSISPLMPENMLQTLPKRFRLKGLERDVLAANAPDDIPVRGACRGILPLDDRHAAVR